MGSHGRSRCPRSRRRGNCQALSASIRCLPTKCVRRWRSSPLMPASRGFGRTGEPGRMAIHVAQSCAASDRVLSCVSRPPSASPAVGLHSVFGASKRTSSNAPSTSSSAVHMYATDRGIEGSEERRADEQFATSFLAERMRTFVDTHPEFGRNRTIRDLACARR